MANREQLEALRAKWNGNVTAARRLLGKALLGKPADVPEARRVLAVAKQTLEEVEAMLLVVDEVKEPESKQEPPKQEVKQEQPKQEPPKRQQEPEPERLWDEEVAWKTLPRVTQAEYQSAKKRFESDYEKLKGTPALLVRGKELASLAKASGEKDASDCKRFLRRFGGSPELSNLI